MSSDLLVESGDDGLDPLHGLLRRHGRSRLHLRHWWWWRWWWSGGGEDAFSAVRDPCAPRSAPRWGPNEGRLGIRSGRCQKQQHAAMTVPEVWILRSSEAAAAQRCRWEMKTRVRMRQQRERASEIFYLCILFFNLLNSTYYL